jgi:hypothetical protein
MVGSRASEPQMSRVEDGRSGCALRSLLRFPSPLIKPDVLISSIRFPTGVAVRPTAGVHCARSDRLNRHEATLWRQSSQILLALNALDRRKLQERTRFCIDDVHLRADDR